MRVNAVRGYSRSWKESWQPRFQGSTTTTPALWRRDDQPRQLGRLGHDLALWQWLYDFTECRSGRRRGVGGAGVTARSKTKWTRLSSRNQKFNSRKEPPPLAPAKIPELLTLHRLGHPRDIGEACYHLTTTGCYCNLGVPTQGPHLGKNTRCT